MISKEGLPAREKSGALAAKFAAKSAAAPGKSPTSCAGAWEAQAAKLPRIHNHLGHSRNPSDDQTDQIFRQLLNCQIHTVRRTRGGPATILVIM